MSERPGRATTLGLLAVLLAFPSPAQEGRPQQPTFPSDVELVAVDVNVVDGDGNPVRGLAAGDFQVKVEGKPRRVLSVDFIETPSAESAAAGTAAPADEAPARVAPGRLIVFAVDRGQVSFGALQVALTSAQRLVAGLSPEDRVAVLALPTGPRLDFTTDRGAVRRAFDEIGPANDLTLGQYRVGLAEAMQLVAGDVQGEDVTARECAQFITSGTAFEGCRVQVVAQARQLVADYGRQVRERLIALEALCHNLAALPGPKVLVLLSAGLMSPFHAADTDITGRMQRVAEEAAAARVTLYTLHLRQFGADFDASRGGLRSFTAEDDERLRMEGLEALNGLAGGTFLDVVAAGRGTFERVAREISGHYLLGLEPDERDRDGKPRTLSVAVTRPKVQVRARRQFVAGARASAAHAVAAAAAPALPLQVATVALDAGAGGKVKVLLAAEVQGAAPAQVAYRIVDAAGAVAGESSSMLGGAAPLRFDDAVLLAPGDYTLKIGVRDSAGGRGREERSLRLRLVDGEGLAASDLMVLERQAGKLRLLAGPTTAGELAVYVEVYPRPGTAADAIGVTLEVVPPAGGAQRILSLPVRRANEGGALFAEGHVDLPAPPGTYLLRARVAVGGGPPVTVERAVERRAALP